MSTAPVPKQFDAPKLRFVKAGEFKATCLALLDEKSLRKQPLAITKHGEVVAHVIAPPAEAKPFRSIFGRSARPGVHIPSVREWAKLKAEWAAESEASLKKLSKSLRSGPSRKSKQS